MAVVLQAAAFRLDTLTSGCKLLASNVMFNKSPTLLHSGDAPELDDRTKDRIAAAVASSKVFLFMKGNKLEPQCGFSNTACRILDALETTYETFDVLADEEVRAGIKVYSQWPTIPQLYIEGEFVGGTDIMIEMYQDGSLAEMVELANAS